MKELKIQEPLNEDIDGLPTFTSCAYVFRYTYPNFTLPMLSSDE